MCVVSMVSDHYNDKWREAPWNPNGGIGGTQPWVWPSATEVSRAEFEQLKRDVEEMKALLIRAKIYDEVNNEKDCEMESKVAALRKIAELVGVNLDEVFGAKS